MRIDRISPYALLCAALFAATVAACAGEQVVVGVEGDRGDVPCDDDRDCADDNPCEVGICGRSGVCSFVAQPGRTCDDDNACTEGERCDELGRCSGGEPVALESQPCKPCRCDPVTGVTCDWEPAGAPCNDADCCTREDRCATCDPSVQACFDGETVCRGVPRECPDDNDCTRDVCECTDGAARCRHVPEADGVECVLNENACTLGDTCQGGVCIQGEPASGDDGNPCTRDVCIKGVFEHEPLLEGQCDDGDACTLDDRCLLGNCAGGEQVTCARPACASSVACVDGEGCVVQWLPDGAACNSDCSDGGVCQGNVCIGGRLRDGDGDGVPDITCGGPDCNDNDPSVNPGQAEICDDGVDNDCDGAVDAADSACGGDQGTPNRGGTPVGASCDFHTDCWPSGVCATWRTTNAAVCSQACSGASDCEAGQVCSKIPGSAQIGFCEDAPALLADGVACTDDFECASALCVGGACRGLCLDESHCREPGHTCHPVGDLAAGLIQSACNADDPAALDVGQPCTGDGIVYDSSFCRTGHCDLTSPSPIGQVCSPLCKSELDCPGYQVCGVVLYGDRERADNNAYDALWQNRTHDAATACYTPPEQGIGVIGSRCTHPRECRSYKCFGLSPDDPAMYCTTFCTYDDECPAGMQCKIEAVTLASPWLQDPFNGSQPPRPGAWTYVRVCKFN